MNSSSNSHTFWILGCLALAIVFPSCQSGSTDAADPVPTGERTKVAASYSIKSSEPFKKADSLTWSAPSQSGAGLVPHLSDSNSTYLYYSTSIQLKTPLKDGILSLSLWSHGIRFLQAQFKAAGTTDTLQIIGGSAQVDSIALILLRGLDSLKATLPQTREGLLTLYGTWILAGDARIKGFPDSLPVGLSVTEVIQATLVVASKTGKTLAEQAAAWSLGISTDSATSIGLKLIQSNRIESKDSSALFPPPPVRVKTPLAVGTGLRAGGVSVGVTGAFEWDEGLGLVAFQGSVTRNGVTDTNLVVYGLPVPKTTDRSAKFEGSVSLLAKAEAPEGTYVLTITAQDGAQHTATSSASFQVATKLPDQPLAPRIRPLSPADKSTVPFETAEVVTTWIAATPQGSIDSVKADGTAAEKLNDSTWQAKVRLEPTGKARTIVAKVVNSAGIEAVATLELTRQADAAGPVITWISPTADLDVENGVTSLTVRIKATDPSGIDTVLIAGSKPDSLTAAGEYVRKVQLIVVGSPQAITVRVVDNAKNATTASKSITRANPATDVPPKAVLLDPASKTGTVVPFETKSVTIRWQLTDPYGIDSASVTINGKPAKPEGGDKWSAVVDLVAGGTTTILLAVKNKNGVSGGDVASVTRKSDTIPPALSWIAGGRSVGYDSTEVVVSGKAIDNDSLVSVTINGLVATGSDGSYAAKLKLEVGDNPVTAIATDRTGLKDTIQATVHRYQKLSITRIAPLQADTTIGAAVGAVALSWKVVGAKSVGVGDVALVRTGDIYTWTTNLSGASTRVVLWALDSAGKRDSSEVTVTRKQEKDTVKPALHRAAATKDTVVQSTMTSIAVSWSVSDEHLRKVTIDGATVVGTAGDFTASVALDSTSKWIVIEASDSTANVSRDSILVRRVFPPAVSPKSGGYAITVLASLTTEGSGTIEYALGAPSGWKAYGGAALSITSNAKLYARTILDGVASEIVEAEYAFAPVLALAKTPDSGAAAADVNVTATGNVDDIEFATDTSSATANWATLVGGSIPVSTARVFARCVVGASKSSIVSLAVHLYPKRPTVWPAPGGYGSPQFVLVPETPTTATLEYSKLDDKTTWYPYPNGLVIPVPVSGTLYLRATSSTGDVTEISANYLISTGAWNTGIVYDTVRDRREGRMYRSIKIGTQTWMAENLAYDTLDGVGSWCKDDMLTACTLYGRLYTWQTAMAGAPGSDLIPSGQRGLCLQGWHIPSDEEWRMLPTLLGGTMVAGQKSKSTYGWSGISETSDSVGFRALPGGLRTQTGSYSADGTAASWWVATEDSQTQAWKWYLGYDNPGFDSDFDSKDKGMSVRCLKN